MIQWARLTSHATWGDADRKNSMGVSPMPLCSTFRDFSDSPTGANLYSSFFNNRLSAKLAVLLRPGANVEYLRGRLVY